MGGTRSTVQMPSVTQLVGVLIRALRRGGGDGADQASRLTLCGILAVVCPLCGGDVNLAWGSRQV